LAITAAPDDRRSTHSLELIVREITQRHGHAADLWYLRHHLGRAPEKGSRVVDDLRTWTPSNMVEQLGAPKMAARLRGLRLRSWLHEIKPDIVVLDDGLGSRVLDPLRQIPTIIVRVNATPPVNAQGEPRFDATPALHIIGSDVDIAESRIPGRHIIELPLAEAGADRCADPGVRRARRDALGLPREAPLITGWGDDGWLDGPDLFVRALWALHHRHSLEAHAVWFGLSADRDEGERLRQDVHRMGLSRYFHLRPDTGTVDRLCGDAVFLSCRDAAEPSGIAAAVLAGPCIVAFRACDIFEPARQVVRLVDDIDVEAAAGALAAGLREDREERWRRSRSAALRLRTEVRRLADEILALSPETP
jgi:hypothetical protein